MNRLISLITLFILIISSCATTKDSSTMHGESYDEKTNTTTYILIPYGNVEIPGKWKRTTLNKVSRQQFFVNNDSTTLAVAKGPIEKYPFYDEKREGFDVVNDFYVWDSEYWVEQGYSASIIEENKTENYIVWQIQGDGVDNIFLFGLKKNLIINYMISSKWSKQDKVDFLIDLYKDN